MEKSELVRRFDKNLVNGEKKSWRVHEVLIGQFLFIKTISSILHDAGGISPSKVD